MEKQSKRSGTNATMDLGKAVIRPKRAVRAGAQVTLTYTYTAGHPIDDSGFVMIAFRQIGDFASPQFDDPSGENYCSIHTDGDCVIEPRWDEKGHVRPWSRTLMLGIRRGFLDSGERITLVFGDTSGGSPGWRVQTFCERGWEFRTFVDPIATRQFKQLASSPALRINPGPAVRAICIAPSQVDVGKGFAYHLKLEDCWGNPIRKPRRLTHRGFAAPGVQTVDAMDKATGLAAVSNPIDILPGDGKMRPRRYWADFHGQSGETIGTDTIEDYFTFARDTGLLDIAGHQGNDFQVTDAFWDTINRTARAFNEPGRFVTFPGYEWSGNTPLGGDRNIYFESEGGTIARSCCDLLDGGRSKFLDAPTASDLFERLRKQSSPSAFGFAHVGGRYADVSAHDEGIELAMEVHSAWGTFEWLVDDAFARGYRIGVCANSDGHKCRPGASYPGATEFGSYGGLTCVLADRLDRPAVVEALRARHFYATTGCRPLIDASVAAADGREVMMGDVIDAGEGVPVLRVRVAASAAIESAEIRNGVDRIGTRRPYAADDLAERIKIVWGGAEVRGRGRMCAWDGGLRVWGNSIVAAQPINFFRPDRPLQRLGASRLAWSSRTTGGVAGVVLTLRKADAGVLEIDTAQRKVRVDISSIGLRPRTWNCGGLAKRLSAYRLPASGGRREFTFSVPLRKLHRGDNPIYTLLTFEDGHMAWTSPIYLVC